MGSGEVTSQLDRIEVLCLEIRRMLREQTTPRALEADPCGCSYYASVTIDGVHYPKQLHSTCTSKHHSFVPVGTKRKRGQ